MRNRKGIRRLEAKKIKSFGRNGCFGVVLSIVYRHGGHLNDSKLAGDETTRVIRGLL